MEFGRKDRICINGRFQRVSGTRVFEKTNGLTGRHPPVEISG